MCLRTHHNMEVSIDYKKQMVDNPSPYLIDDDAHWVDFGQVLYGFESIYYQHHYDYVNNPQDPLSVLFPPPPDTYSDSYVNFPVRIVDDLAGWVANVITPATEYFLDVKSTGNNPKKTLEHYFKRSAPVSDLYANADSIGIWWAYNVLKHNSDLKLSDVFTLYYKGGNHLRTGIMVSPSPHFPYYTNTNRWKIFSLFFGFMDENENWIPDNPTQWQKVKGKHSNNNPLGRSYVYDDNQTHNDRLRFLGFAEFWYTRLKSPKWTGFCLSKNIEIDNDDIVRFDSSSNGNFIGSGKNEKEWVLNIIKTLFETYFLQNFLKDKVI